MTWIRTSERLPTEEDAVEWDQVNVLLRHGVWAGTPIMRHYLQIREERHTHWAKLPDLPEEE